MTPETWTKAKPLIEAAIARGLPTHTADDVRADIDAGRQQLWCEGETAIVTEIVTFPRMKACRVVYVAGRMADVERLKPEIEGWARGEGCGFMLAGGRKGWVRTLRDYFVTAHLLAKEII